MLPLAHAGHYVLWSLYLPPIAIVVFSVVRNKLVERRERKRS